MESVYTEHIHTTLDDVSKHWKGNTTRDTRE